MILSILQHITGICANNAEFYRRLLGNHEFPHFTKHKRCEHPVLTPDRKPYMTEGRANWANLLIFLGWVSVGFNIAICPIQALWLCRRLPSVSSAKTTPTFTTCTTTKVKSRADAIIEPVDVSLVTN
jgi:hypothetical protein